jgi:ActR/RegA family two-component response regulator
MERWVLFVEDDANFREVFTRLLREALAPEQLDVAFVEAGSAAEARARLREGGLDAALIDITLPDGNGLDLVGDQRWWFRQAHPDSSVGGDPGDLRGRPSAGGWREGSTLQASFGARDRRCDK